MVRKDFTIHSLFKIIPRKNSFDFDNVRKRYRFHIGVKLGCVELASWLCKTIE